MNDKVTVTRALISVSDKTGLVAFARHLANHGVQIISTGGTASAIRDAGIKVTPVEHVTQFPEMMDGRVKTLHPNIHGGLLARRDNPSHVEAMNSHGIEPIDLVCVNLYPFEQTIARPDVTPDQAIEQIDIGGPSMVRSAAKNHDFVAVVTDPSQYNRVADCLDANQGATTFELRRGLATEAFAHTAAYDATIARWMSASTDVPFAENLVMCFHRHPTDLRYGENPHQSGALNIDPQNTEPAVAGARQRHGIPLSYCNIFDSDGAVELVKEIDPTRYAAAAVIKHANPCGFAVAEDLPTAFNNAYQGDPLAAYGGIVALNRRVDQSAADAICAGNKFLHVIIAPSYEDQAVEQLKQRWKDIRILQIDPLGKPTDRAANQYDLRRITGGLLVQLRDLASFDKPQKWDHVAGPKPDNLRDIALAMICVKHLKSNAICLIKNGALVGAGAGQMDRLQSGRIAVEKAGERARGAIAGSDAFFPFRDGPDHLIAAGVRAIVQPGGSKRDDDSIAACNEANVTMLFTGRRHFRH